MATPTAAQTSGLLNLEKELVCFICTEVLYQPLTLIDCLHTFCGSCLKEWFSHQYRKAAHSHIPPPNPYTCPTCRAVVKDVQHNAMINTLLEMFLAANSDKQRSIEDKAEMAKVYKPGDNIIPKVDSRRRERRRREEDDSARRERRDDARERSRRDGEPSAQNRDRLAPHTTQERSRSRSGGHDDRRDRRIQEREQRRHMRDRVEAAEARLRDDDQPVESQEPSHSPPPTSPRHPDAVEARSRGARTVAHQASIRSLVSASDSGTGTGDSLNEARLMQEILSEGLLDDINVDDLTETQQDELSEIIAERYRQLHPDRTRRAASNGQNGSVDQHGDGSRPSSLALQNTQLEEADRSHQQSRDAARRSDVGPRPRSISDQAAEADPPAASSQTSRQEQNLSPPPQERAHRRRASDQSGRDRSAQRTRGTVPGPGHAAARSVTDLSDRPQTEEAAAADGPRRLLNTGRAQTEPRQVPTASEMWNRGGLTISRNRPSPLNSPTNLSPQVQNATIATTAAAISQSSAPALPAEVESQTKQAPVTTSFDEPHVSCYRCQRENIQYEVYKHCSSCDVDLCRRCYRTGRGCNHWFGFGHSAIARFDASHPRSRASQQIELPHLLVGRQYRSLSQDSITSKKRGIALTTSSDPSSRLQEGHFCDSCSTFTNACFWTCDSCNDGEWGFCNSCVATHHCCTHPLLPMAHKDYAPGSPFQLQPIDPFANHLNVTPGHSAPSSATSAADAFAPQADYVQLSITTHCDICTQPIPPSQSRYHCPSHPTPTPQNPGSVGDYDICTPCYHNLIKIGRMRRDDGPAGWRKCTNGHRMIVTNFETDADGGQRRVIVSDLVGGVKMSEEHIKEWTVGMEQVNEKDRGGLGASGQVGLSRGKWTWYDPAEGDVTIPSPNASMLSGSGGGGERRTKSRQAQITPSSPAIGSATHKASSSNPRFPPNGGFGKACTALWSYYPDEGEDGKGELMFPRGAEVREAEDVNEDWCEGVYSGCVGLVPRVYVRDLV